jgi:WD40 repeat protein
MSEPTTSFNPDHPTASFEPDSPVNVILAEYLEACRQGTAPSREELLAKHPEYAKELDSFLAGQAALKRVAPPPRSPLETATFDGRDRPIAVPGEVVRYFGDYELISEIARGGMGVVYRARQVSLNRVVALKMILSGQLAAESDVTRFRAEAEAAANLDHPNIVPIYEVGEHQGQHYFSMKLVDGGSLSQSLAGKKPPIRDLVQKLAIVSRAVHYAHQRGIMHRDLKPANILLDSQGHPHISDFGLAKHLTGDSRLTMSGSIVGTPSYMPPEQALGSKGITVAADVYSLGAILYEFLVGKPPFKGESILETLRQVREQEPVRPRVIDPAVDRDLETIALKCLEKDPARRYESAAALADDLQCWLEGKPIAARPATSAERAWKWARRRPAIAGLIAAVAASLIVGIAVSTGFALDAKTQADLAREAEAEAKRKAEAEAAAHMKAEQAFIKEADARQQEVIAKGKEITAREAAERAQKLEKDAREKEAIARRQAEDERNAKDKEFVRADGLRLAAEADAARFRDPGLALLLATEGAKRTPNHLTFASLYAALAECREERTFFANTDHSFDGPDRGWYLYQGNASFSRFLPGGKQILTAVGNSLRVWDVDSGKMVSQWKGYNLPIQRLALSPDAKRVAILTSGHAPVRHADGVVYHYTDRVVYVIDLAKGTDVLRLRGSKYTMESVEFSRDGKQIAVASWDGHARVYDAESGKLVKDIAAAKLALVTARLTPDGKKLFTVTSNVSRGSYGYDDDFNGGKVKTDPEIDPEARPLGPSGYGSGSFSGLEGTGTIGKLWDIETGKETATFTKLPPGFLKLGHVWYPKDAALSPDGTLAAISFPGEITVWEAATGDTQCTMKGLEGDVTAVAFRPDGKQLASAGADKTVRLWDVRNGRELLRLRGHTEGVTGIRFSPSGKKLVSWSSDGTARVWDVDSGAELTMLRGHRGVIRDADFREDELRVTTAGDTSIRVWTLEAPKMPDLQLAGHAGKVTAIAYSPDGKFFLTSSADQSARLWDTATGKVVREFGDGRPLGEVRSARFSPDGTKVVTAAANRSARAGEKSVESAVIVWDVATGKQLLSLDELPTGATHAEFTPDGGRILTVGDGSLRIQFNTRNEDPKLPEKKIDLGGLSYSISSSGNTNTGTQHLWDAKTGKLVSTLFKGKEGGWTLGGERTTYAFSPDGSHVFTVNKNGQIATLYRASDGKEVRTFLTKKDWGPVAVGLSPDGATAVVEKQSVVSLYDTNTGLLIASLKGFPGSVADFAFSQDGKKLGIASYKAAFVYEMPERKLVSVLKGHLADVTKVAFSPDGSRVLTGAADDTAAAWDTATGKMLAVFKGHTGKLSAVLFRKDGQQVATLGDDGSARLWPVDLWPGVAARTPRTLTSEEAERFEVAIPGRPKQVDWRDRVPASDPPPGSPRPELLTLAKNPEPAEAVQKRQAALAALKALPTGTPAEMESARTQANAFRRANPGTVEAAAAGELLMKLPSPLASLDPQGIAAAERGGLPKDVVAVLGESRQRESSSMQRVALSPAGKVIATRTWSDANTILWDAETLDRRGRVGGELIGFIGDREELATFASQPKQSIRFYDVSGKEPKPLREVAISAGQILAISKDGRIAAGTGQAYDEFRVWDLSANPPTSRRVHKSTSGYNDYHSWALSPSGDRLALQVAGTMFVYALKDPAKPPVQLNKPQKGSYGENNGVTFSPDGTRLVARHEGALVVWDVAATPPKEVGRLTKKDASATDFHFSADGSKLFVQYYGRDGAVWDLKVNPPVEKPEFTKFFGGTNAFVLSKDENRLFASIGVAIRGFDRTPEGWRERPALAGATHGITSLSFSPDGRTLYAADGAEGLRAWSLDGNRFTESKSIGSFGRWVHGMPDGGSLLGGTYGFARWDMPAFTRRGDVLDRKSYSPVHNSLSADGRWLARGNFKPVVTLWDLSGAAPRKHATIEKLTNERSMGAVAISPDGRFLIAAPDQQNDPEPLQAWRVTEKGVDPMALPYISGGHIAFAPDGRTLAVADARSLSFVDLSQAVPAIQPAIELPDYSSRWGADLLFTPDGSRLVTLRNRSITVVKVADRAKLPPIELPITPECAALAPDGKHLALGNPNGTVWILRLP